MDGKIYSSFQFLKYKNQKAYWCIVKIEDVFIFIPTRMNKWWRNMKSRSPDIRSDDDLCKTSISIVSDLVEFNSLGVEMIPGDWEGSEYMDDYEDD